MHPAIQFVVSLPDPIKLAIVALVTVGIAGLFNLLTLYAPWLASVLGPYKDQAVVLISGFVITWIEAQLNLFPQYEPITNAVLALLVVILGVFGLPFLVFKALQRKGFRAFASVKSIQ